MNTEPILTAGGIAAIVAALLALLTNFGLPISGEQSEAILILVGVIAPFLIAFLRAQPWVTPVAGEISWPVFNAAVVGTIVSAVLGCLVAFGVPISATQGNALLTFVAAIVPLAIALFAARAKVRPLSGPR